MVTILSTMSLNNLLWVSTHLMIKSKQYLALPTLVSKSYRCLYGQIIFSDQHSPKANHDTTHRRIYHKNSISNVGPYIPRSTNFHVTLTMQLTWACREPYYVSLPLHGGKIPSNHYCTPGLHLPLRHSDEPNTTLGISSLSTH